jgi:hypothetical protein
VQGEEGEWQYHGGLQSFRKMDGSTATDSVTSENLDNSLQVLPTTTTTVADPWTIPGTKNFRDPACNVIRTTFHRRRALESSSMLKALTAVLYFSSHPFNGKTVM